MGEHLASRADVARLFGRAAFGAKPGDLNRWSGQPYANVVEHLLAVPPGGTNPVIDVAADVIDVVGEVAELASTTTPLVGQLWWLNRMLTTPFPLEERMTLFWHDHFATAFPVARGDELLNQNQTLRSHALGNFRNLVYDITIDPAMLKWLNGTENVAGQPNENYAREFFELFTLGTSPQVFTETDVREASRAFTGWEAVLTVLTKSGQFQAARHDTGTKIVLGQNVPNLGADEHKRVADIALAHPVAPRFIAYKLVQNLAYEPEVTDLLAAPDPLIEEVASALVASDWDIRAGVRALLMSDHFRYADPASGRQVVRQPIEIAIHTLKALGLPLLDDAQLVSELRISGQAPFEPPNVGGWPLGEAWLTQSTYLGLYGLTARAQKVRDFHFPLPLLRNLPRSTDIRAGGGAWAAAMGLHALSPTTLAAVRSFVASGQGGNETQLQDGIFQLIANSPDWQVM